MLKSGMNVEKIAVKLNIDARTLHTKISRAFFSSGFFFQVINLLECENLYIKRFLFFTNILMNNNIKSE